jgi:S-DNA-T family DNA segregation ATPase FtsK/SpoIIIE
MADPTTRVEEAFVKAGLLAGAAVLGAAALGLWFALRHPRTTTVTVAGVAAYVYLGPGGLTAAAVGLAVVLVVWRRAHRASFDWCLLGPWRRATRYSWRWAKAIPMCGLDQPFRPTHTGVDEVVGLERPRSRRYLPKLKRVRSDQWCDRVTVRLLAGQHPGMWEDCTDHLAHTFGAMACRVESPRPGRIVLVFLHRDRLAEVVPALRVPAEPDLLDLAIGVLEDGRPWTVQVAGSHLLVAGATGSGKGSVVWSLIRAMAPCIHDGTVQVWAADPKGGMELGPGAPMFTRFAYDTPAGMADLFDQAVEAMDERKQRMQAEGRRKHTPTAVEPLVVVVVDEMAFLTAYMPDRDLRKRITNSLAVLLTQGRAVGFVVVAALQDPRKEVAALRDLFPRRIALRLTEPEQTRLVLGPGAHERGAECENVPESLPGVGFQVIDGLAHPIKARAGWVTDEDIAAMVEQYPARRGNVIDTTATPGDGPWSDSTVIDLPARRPAEEPPGSAA